MKYQNKDIMKLLKITGVALAVTLGANAAVAGTWSDAPAGTPPANNAEAPIHVGITPQTKLGALTVGGVHSLTNGNFDGVVIANGLGQSPSFLMTGINDITSDVVLRKDGTNAYIWPWGTGYQSNTVIVGNGASAPTSLSVTGTLSAAAFKLANGSAAGKVLTSDASGNATWQPASGGGGSSGAGTAGKVSKWVTANTLGDSVISDSGSLVQVASPLIANGGIGAGGDIVAGGTLAASDSGGTGIMLSGFGQVAISRDANALYLWPSGTPTAQAIVNVGSGGHPLNLNVTGALSAVNVGISGNFNLAPSAGTGKVLTSDSAGNGRWQSLSQAVYLKYAEAPLVAGFGSTAQVSCNAGDTAIGFGFGGAPLRSGYPAVDGTGRAYGWNCDTDSQYNAAAGLVKIQCWVTCVH